MLSVASAAKACCVTSGLVFQRVLALFTHSPEGVRQVLGDVGVGALAGNVGLQGKCLWDKDRCNTAC